MNHSTEPLEYSDTSHFLFEFIYEQWLERFFKEWKKGKKYLLQL